MIVDNWHANVDVFAIVEALSVSSYTTTIHENIHRPPHNLKLRWRWCSLLASCLATVSGIAFHGWSLLGVWVSEHLRNVLECLRRGGDAQQSLFFASKRFHRIGATMLLYIILCKAFVTGKTWASSDRG